MAVPCRKRLILAEEQWRGVGSEEVDVWRKKRGTVTVIWQIDNNADLSKGRWFTAGQNISTFFFFWFIFPLFNVSPMIVRRNAKWTSCQMLRDCFFTWIQLSLDNCTFNTAFIESVFGRLPNGLVRKVPIESDWSLVILMLVLSLHSPISSASCD